MADKPTDARERLRQNFLDHDPKQHPNRWEHLWQQDDLPWDKGFASPALADVLADRKDLLPTAESGRRLRALVPGCGKGYDVLLLASWGYDAVGVEAAATAVKAANAESKGWEEKPEYVVKDETKGRGSAKFVFGDFFEKEWEKDAIGEDGSKEGQWDLIYDYTFLCALPPALRPNWAARQSSLLSPGGRLICLEFPTYKPPSTGGPPWALRPETYLAHLSQPGKEVEYDEEGFAVWKEGQTPGDSALERIAHWKPERTHKIGEGTDNVSVWKRA
ncbi:S-adenosyl-L-methionine-dependent methyltransferase [Aureobasidium sp. EXF-12298]|nr:S-adenosyl-L-methionine-dependent methyltransferase [Aureobasidium sp. EXF-12298]KAI4753593.1 S-adenosyl-L-methionine-dependent methyltransferase [Aureobasidium sp. EXF-12344]KAI4770731.1 S-adenosyl-L-methionine-dependent methyltransferase [Aureobasidium sp. EXF-3400]